MPGRHKKIIVGSSCEGKEAFSSITNSWKRKKPDELAGIVSQEYMLRYYSTFCIDKTNISLPCLIFRTGNWVQNECAVT